LQSFSVAKEFIPVFYLCLVMLIAKEFMLIRLE
jgi:hypothetical protein